MIVTLNEDDDLCVVGDPVPVLAGADHPEAPRVRGPDDRTQDGEGEQAQLLRRPDQGRSGRTGRPSGRQQQGGLSGQSIKHKGKVVLHMRYLYFTIIIELKIKSQTLMVNLCEPL